MHIYFAGAEQNVWTRALLQNGVKHILYSFFYLWAHHRELGAYDHLTENRDVSWFLDSGAFTYGSSRKLDHNMLDPHEYVAMYYRYVDRYGKLYDRIAEPDLDFADGVEVSDIRDWRNEMLKNWPDLPICPVWHVHRGIDEWHRYCRDDRIRHLAIGSDVTDCGLLRRLTNEAREAGKTIHGFAMTKMKINEMVRFTSVDSSTWATAFRYGHMYVWMADKFYSIPASDKRARGKARKFYKANGLDVKKILADDSDEVRRCNIIAWRLLSERWQEKAKRMEMALAEEGEPKWTTILERG